MTFYYLLFLFLFSINCYSISEKMKAIRISEFGEPCVLKLIENLMIPKPSENEVLIEVKYAGVNPVDTYRRAGKYSVLPTLPWVPGSDCSGIISALGSNIRDKFSIGQRVFTTSTITGSYASHALASVHHVHALPSKLSFQQGASLGTPYFTAYSALFDRGQAKSGETVLIHGASGAVGIAAIQLAKANNLTVIGTAGTTEGLDMIKSIGADYVFNHNADGYVNEIKGQFANKINIVIEMLANQNLVVDCEMAAIKARIMIVGCRGTINFDPRLTMGKLLDVRGVALGMNSLDQWENAGLQMSNWMESGDICPIISKEYDLQDAGKAHHDIIFNSGTTGKLVLRI